VAAAATGAAAASVAELSREVRSLRSAVAKVAAVAGAGTAAAPEPAFAPPPPAGARVADAYAALVREMRASKAAWDSRESELLDQLAKAKAAVRAPPSLAHVAARTWWQTGSRFPSRQF